MVNQKLKAVRRQKMWSQSDVAEKVGVSEVTYSRWENGQQKPYPKLLKALCDAFEMSPGDLGFDYLVEEISIYPIQNNHLGASSQKVTIQQVVSYAPSSNMRSRPYNWSFSNFRISIESAIDQAIGGFEIMSQNQLPGKKLSRRQILNLLKVAPVAAFGLEQFGDSREEEILTRSAVNIPLCWRLYFAGGQQDVRHELPGYLAQLTSLVQTTSSYQKTIAELLSQAHQLAYLLELQSQNFQIAEAHVSQAFNYGILAGDKNLQVSALIRKGNLYHTRKWPSQTLKAYQEALTYIDESVSPLLAGQMYVGLAEASARLSLTSHSEQHRQDAQRYARLARENFPSTPEADPHFSYTHFNNFTVTNFEGLANVHLNKAEEAWNIFDKIGTLVPQSIVPQRAELLSRQLTTALAMNDLERCEIFLPLAVDAAIKVESDLRYSEVYEAYEQMQGRWGNDSGVKNLADLFAK